MVRDLHRPAERGPALEEARDAEVIEHGDEVGIAGRVVDDEPGFDRHVAGGTGGGSDSVTVGYMFRNLLGMKIRMIVGYPGGNEI